ncbi:putative small-subunit processome [Paratrimastix pyriformis]|uniref:Small-subunit processome n=1 Tax=Paratrimastix pyriformis TaxID=342808 RepID=A0ABQ8UCZ9_9EUKA|nr:putative small-subunit processome [Paratrimastix pyriformis]
MADVLDSLLAPLADSAGFTDIKQKFESFEKSGKALAEPLQAPQQERMNRDVNYGDTSRDLGKWQGIVKAHREAEHISFPLNNQTRITQTTVGIASSFRPQTDLEKELAAVLPAAEKHVRLEAPSGAGEIKGLAMNPLTVEDVEKKQQYLAKLRAVMSYQDAKFKRMKKIKSKNYHKIMRRAKDKQEGSMTPDELAKLDPAAAAEQQLEGARDRAEERATQRHKNTSKWIRRQLRLGAGGSKSAPGAGSREAIHEQLRVRDALMKRMGDKAKSQVLKLDASAAGGAAATRRKRARASERESLLKSTKGLFALKFMQRAMEKQTEASELLEELGEGEGADPLAALAADAAPVGRRSFGTVLAPQEDQPAPIPTRLESADADAADADADAAAAAPEKPKSAGKPTKAGAVANPWLDEDAKKATTAGSASAISARTGIASAGKKAAAKRAAAPAVDQVAPDLSDFLPSAVKERTPAEAGQQSAAQPVMIAAPAATATATATATAEPTAEAGEEGAAQPAGEEESQESLVRRIFVGGAEADEFAKAKQEAIDATKPKSDTVVLPGWYFARGRVKGLARSMPTAGALDGAWGGAGVKAPSRTPKAAVVRRKRAADEEQMPDADQRKDKNLPHVIINEKRDKKILPFLVQQLPHPYQTQAQYEVAMRTPVGVEWATLTQHQKLTVPKVELASNTVIDPIKYHKKEADRANMAYFPGRTKRIRREEQRGQGRGSGARKSQDHDEKPKKKQ